MLVSRDEWIDLVCLYVRDVVGGRDASDTETSATIVVFATKHCPKKQPYRVVACWSASWFNWANSSPGFTDDISLDGNSEYGNYWLSKEITCLMNIQCPEGLNTGRFVNNKISTTLFELNKFLWKDGKFFQRNYYFLPPKNPEKPSIQKGIRGGMERNSAK